MGSSWLTTRKRRTAAATMLLLSIVVTLGGCAPNYTDYDAFMKTPRPAAGGKPYVIDPPDAIRIIAPNAPELNNVQATLRPDGYITLSLIGEVFAAGKTPVQLASEIEEKALKYYQDVTVQVEVVAFRSKLYYMAGETSAGPKPYTGRDTVLDAVLGAGVPRSSWPAHVIVLRPDESGGTVHRMTVSVEDMYRKGDLKHNAVLEEGDILYMPQNPLAAIGSAVQNLLMPVDPIIAAGRVPAEASTFGAAGAAR